MFEHRFKPPSAEVRDAPPTTGSAVKGLVLGILVDLGGTTLFGIVLGIAYAVFLASTGQSEAQIKEAFAGSQANPLISGISLVGGLAFSVLGGYVCERVARRASYGLGIVLSLLSATVGLLLGWSMYSLPMNGLLAFLTVGSILLGTRVALERREL